MDPSEADVTVPLMYEVPEVAPPEDPEFPEDPDDVPVGCVEDR
jgi:hypothetical protein